MKRKLHLIIYVAIIVLLTGCAQKPRKFVIGVSQCSEDIWRDKLNDELKMGEYLNDSLIVKLASSNDDNVKKVGKITYLPIYMLMFIKKEQKLPTKYSIDLSGLV